MSYKDKLDYIFYRLQKAVPTTYTYQLRPEMIDVIVILGQRLIIHRDNIDELYLKIDEYCETYQTIYIQNLNEELEDNAKSNGRR